MVAYNKIEGFVGYLGLGAVNCNTDTFKLYLSNATPSSSADDVKGDIAEISIANGYTGPVDIQNTYAEAGGTGTCTVVDVVITASGVVGPFQYVAVYDDTHASDILINWWDYGTPITLAASETFTIDFTGNILFTLV